ncbi:MAG TPA: bifunctional phosphopantothenoylcysteine decarboxylase/phosphopantothenate--cysteine ligase CoaBC [Rhodothermales bacterium]|nr:bifunctional phosphopantothenoylcysteine decarboxylase/phosphopantothenate--cysteine ligase CoaBC [Rhodothermales bacterium]
MSTQSLQGKNLLLGVTGSIAAYKAAEVIRLFKKAGAEVQVLMTPDATRFISPLTLGTLSEREVLIEIFPENEDGSWTKHITLGLWADLFIIAPATAQTLAKLAHGFSDNMLTATALAVRCPTLLCPAMDHDMLLHPATAANLDRLRSFGHEIMEPGYGELASGLVGHGRMPEPEIIFARVAEKLGKRKRKQGSKEEQEKGRENQEPATSNQQPKTLSGKQVLVTAGPTREPIDPVRVITNPSTGTMGYELAAAAARHGAQVTLVSGPTALATPDGVERLDVTTAEEMHEVVQAHKDADLVIMAAAVADYTPTEPAPSKIKKQAGEMTLRLRRTPDILATLGQEKRNGQILVGFAMETDDGLANAQRKLERKNLDWIVLNDLREAGAGFGTGTNRVTLIHRDGDRETLPLMPKSEVAEVLLAKIVGNGEKQKERQE